MVRRSVRTASGAWIRFDVQGAEVGSVLYAVSDDPRVQGAIIDAGEVAVRAALGWLEREAVHVRRGNGNAACSMISRRVTLKRRRRPDCGSHAAGWWRRCSGIARRVLGTRCCIGTRSWPTWPRVPMVDGRHSSAPTSTGRPAPRVRCSRRCCGTNSRSGLVSSGVPVGRARDRRRPARVAG